MKRINFESLAKKLAAQILAEPADFGPDDDVVLVAAMEASDGTPMPPERKSLLQHSRGFVPLRVHTRAEVARLVGSVVRNTIAAYTHEDRATRKFMRAVAWRVEIVRASAGGAELAASGDCPVR